MSQVIVKSEVHPLREIFAEKFDVDFYQREYVWQRKQIEDLLLDLSGEFLKHWSSDHALRKVDEYPPYYMGEIVLSIKSGQRSSIIDGQQRITTLTLLLIYLHRRFGMLPHFPQEVERLICSDYYGENLFNLDIVERKECMNALYSQGEYVPKESDVLSVRTIVDRYADIEECWHLGITEANAIPFTYWIKEKVVFSKVWTNSDEFAYVIFETMNDRGLSLTQVEMLRSYLLASVVPDCRTKAMSMFDEVVKRLMDIKLSSKSKAEFEFFKMYFRGHYAQDFSQTKNSNSDFVRIGKEFHRWVRDNQSTLNLQTPESFVDFIERVDYFSKVYARVNSLLLGRDTVNYLYLVVNGDYGFTLQPALIMAAVSYRDSDEVVNRKIQVVTRYLTKLLSWRVWNQTMISQSSLEATIYELCKNVRGKSCDDLDAYLNSLPMEELQVAPQLNQQNNRRFKVLLALLTEIVSRESGHSDYILNRGDIEIEHVWANHFDRHLDEFSNEQEFVSARNTIGDLLVLDKSFNASYGDDTYEVKVQHYLEHNALAQSLNIKKYENNPGFLDFIARSGLPFKAYAEFKKNAIAERTELYKQILQWHWRNNISVQ